MRLTSTLITASALLAKATTTWSDGMGQIPSGSFSFTLTNTRDDLGIYGEIDIHGEHQNTSVQDVHCGNPNYQGFFSFLPWVLEVHPGMQWCSTSGSADLEVKYSNVLLEVGKDKRCGNLKGNKFGWRCVLENRPELG